MADIDSTEKTKLSEMELEQIADDIGLVAGAIYSALEMIRAADTAEDTSPLEAILEKAGFRCDRCASAFGRSQMCGPWERWAQMQRPELEEVAHV